MCLSAIFLLAFLGLISISYVAAETSTHILLKTQIESGIGINDLACYNPEHLLVIRPNEKLACLTLETALKTGWEILKPNWSMNDILEEFPVKWSEESLLDPPFDPLNK